MAIGWILCGSSNTASSRIGGFNIHNFLIKIGKNSVILSDNLTYELDSKLTEEEFIKSLYKDNIKIVIFQKVCSDKIKKFVKICKNRNIKTIYTCGDFHESLSSISSIWFDVDIVIVSSPFIKDILKSKGVKSVYYIDDALEVPLYSNFIKIPKKNDILTLGWFGNMGKFNYILNFYKNLNINGIKLFTISNTPKADLCMGDGTNKNWDLDIFFKTMIDVVDVTIIPINISNKLISYAKSANRVTTSIALGIPVIATPIPTYEIICKYTNGCYLATSQNEWVKNIENLKNIEKREINKQEYKLILDEYCIKNITDKFLQIINM